MVEIIHGIEIGHKNGLSLQKKSEWNPITQSCQQLCQGHKIESKSCDEINLEPNITNDPMTPIIKMRKSQIHSHKEYFLFSKIF